MNPATQNVTLKKDAVVTLEQGTNILQITALADAGGKLVLTTENIRFEPNSNDGALALNFVNQNRKVTANVTGAFTLKDGGKISLDENTTIDLNWEDGTNLEITSSGSNISISFDSEKGLHITSED